MPTYYVIGRVEANGSKLYVAVPPKEDYVPQKTRKEVALTGSYWDWWAFDDLALALFEAECMELGGHSGFEVYSVQSSVPPAKLKALKDEIAKVSGRPCPSFGLGYVQVHDVIKPTPLPAAYTARMS